MDIEEQYDKIYRYCYFRLHDPQLAQDLTQETFLRFYQQALDLDSGGKLPYLYVIARNLCVDEFRKKPMVNIEEAEAETACDKTEEWIDNLALRAAIERLPPEEQELLLLRYGNEMPVHSICKIMGISRFAVYRRLSKSLKWLREALK